MVDSPPWLVRTTLQVAQDVIDGIGKDYLVEVLGELGYDDVVRLARAVAKRTDAISRVLQFHDRGVITLDGASKAVLVKSLEG